MSATRKPAPSETASEILKFIRAHHLEMKHEGFLDHCELCLPAYLEISTLFQCITDLRAESGAPLQPGATQPEHDGVAHETGTYYASSGYMMMVCSMCHKPLAPANARRNTASAWCCETCCPNGENWPELKLPRTFTHSELTTLLERMARLVVQEAAKNHVPAHRANECGLVTGYMICMCGRLKADGVTQWRTLWADHLRAEILSKAKLQQLREAVERP